MRKMSRACSVLVLGASIAVAGSVAPALGASPQYKDVCTTGCTYSSVQTAINSITDSSATKVYTVFIDSGVLLSSTSITTSGKSYINFVGRGMGVSIVRASAQWFSNVASSATPPDFFDLTNSTNISFTDLSIDARTADPGGIATPLAFAAVRVDPGTSTGRILVESCEIQGIHYGMWDGDTLGGSLIEIFNSKIRSAQFAVFVYNDRWHIFSSELRVMDDGLTSGTVSPPATLNLAGSDVTVWGSHIHVESSQPGKSYEVNGIKVGSSGVVTVIGSTVHVKMTTTSISLPNRPMAAAYVYTGTGYFIGSEFLYENTGGALSQGRLAGLKLGLGPIAHLVGCTFRDAGGSGGTSRTDVLTTSSSSTPTVQVAGTKIATFANQVGGALPSGIAKTFDTLAGQRGAATFVSSNSVAVTLPVALPDTAYRVGVSANANETIWVEGKTTTGFTLRSSKAASTAIVDWVLMR